MEQTKISVSPRFKSAEPVKVDTKDNETIVKISSDYCLVKIDNLKSGREFLKGISSLSAETGDEPSFKVDFEDGRSLWIGIKPRQVEIACYEKSSDNTPTTTANIPIPLPREFTESG